MIDHASVAAWLDKYVQAWKSYDPAQIGALFSAEARYYYGPFEEPIVGREAIVASWREDRDAEGSYDAHYAPVTVEGMTAVSNGRSLYYTAGSQTVERQFDNIFLLRFNDQGECIEFREWFMEQK